jgi:aminoglycoside phosphotransferase (APT) family kinase protein
LRAKVLAEPIRARLLEKLAALPEGHSLCHGDFHPFNVVGPLESPTLLDWLDACSGPPTADVCRTFVLWSRSNPKLAELYVDTYARIAGARREDVFDWLPIIAGARLMEDVPHEVEELMKMASAV